MIPFRTDLQLGLGRVGLGYGRVEAIDCGDWEGKGALVGELMK